VDVGILCNKCEMLMHGTK